MCGLGFMDTTEVDSVPDAQRVTVDHATGEVLGPEVDVIRSADDKIWQRYLYVLAEAQGLGLNPKPLRLPLERDVLSREGLRLVELSKARKAEVA